MFSNNILFYLLPPRICISNDPLIITHPFNFCADCILSTFAAIHTLRHGPIKNNLKLKFTY